MIGRCERGKPGDAKQWLSFTCLPLVASAAALAGGLDLGPRSSSL